MHDVGMWDDLDVLRCLGCGMWGIWDVGCSESTMLEVWDVKDVELSGCGMFGMWDVDKGYLLGCEILVYKIPSQKAK